MAARGAYKISHAGILSSTCLRFHLQLLGRSLGIRLSTQPRAFKPLAKATRYTYLFIDGFQRSL